jgi:hypothetical protein
MGPQEARTASSLFPFFALHGPSCLLKMHSPRPDCLEEEHSKHYSKISKVQLVRQFRLWDNGQSGSHSRLAAECSCLPDLCQVQLGPIDPRTLLLWTHCQTWATVL